MNIQDPTLQRDHLKSLLTQRANPQSKIRSTVIPISEGTGTPLFCVHGGGADLPAYKRLATLLEGQPCMGLQIIGATSDSPVIRSVTEMAELHRNALEDYPYNGPYILCGHSMGATVALELAQQLQRAGEQVPLLVLIDQPGPDIKLSKRNWLYWQWMAIAQIPWRQRWQYVVNSVRYRFATSRRLPSVVRRTFYSRKSSSESGSQTKLSTAEYRRRMTDATLEALKSYRPQPYQNPMVLFRAESSAPRLHSDPQGGWGLIADRGLQVYEIPGHHMSIFQPPHVSVFAEKLSHCLQQYR